MGLGWPFLSQAGELLPTHATLGGGAVTTATAAAAAGTGLGGKHCLFEMSDFLPSVHVDPTVTAAGTGLEREREEGWSTVFEMSETEFLIPSVILDKSAWLFIIMPLVIWLLFFFRWSQTNKRSVGNLFPCCSLKCCGYEKAAKTPSPEHIESFTLLTVHVCAVCCWLFVIGVALIRNNSEIVGTFLAVLASSYFLMRGAFFCLCEFNDYSWVYFYPYIVTVYQICISVSCVLLSAKGISNGTDRDFAGIYPYHTHEQIVDAAHFSIIPTFLVQILFGSLLAIEINFLTKSDSSNETLKWLTFMCQGPYLYAFHRQHAPYYSYPFLTTTMNVIWFGIGYWFCSSGKAEPKVANTPVDFDTSSRCCICLDKQATHAFIPCGHLCVCKKCWSKLVDMPVESRGCPICKCKLTAVGPTAVRVWHAV